MEAKQVVSGVGKNSSRTDRNLVERTQKIQREATLANASGGAQGSLKMNRELSQGGNMATTASAVSANTTPTGPSVSLPPVDVYAQGRNAPLSEGAPGGPGKGSEILQQPVDSVDQGSALIRAMYLANPTPQMRLMVEAFNEEGR
jgi:hypothetical protein